MKVTIVYGSDNLKAYEKVRSLVDAYKKKNYEVIDVNNQNLSISEAVTSTSLFGNLRLILISDLSKVSKGDLTWMKKNLDKAECDILAYSKSESIKLLLKSFPKETELIEFKLPKLLFTFLENFYPGNTKRAITLFHEVVATEEKEIVFHLLSKQLRDLYWVKVDEKTLPYPSWRVGKLKAQASKFSNEKLAKIIDSLARIDMSVKTSKGELVSSLDLLMATSLE